MGEFLNTLPDVSNFQSSFQLGSGGMQTVQLHGLPVGTTLTLLDGRRLQTNVQGFFDLSNIPLAAVERVEILPVGRFGDLWRRRPGRSREYHTAQEL